MIEFAIYSRSGAICARNGGVTSTAYGTNLS